MIESQIIETYLYMTHRQKKIPERKMGHIPLL